MEGDEVQKLAEDVCANIVDKDDESFGVVLKESRHQFLLLLMNNLVVLEDEHATKRIFEDHATASVYQALNSVAGINDTVCDLDKIAISALKKLGAEAFSWL